MSILPGPLLPVEIIQEFARCVLYIEIATAFDPYGPPVDSCVLRPLPSRTPSIDPEPKAKCIQDGVLPINPGSWDDRDVGSIETLAIEQTRGATHCTKRPTTRELFADARRLILVCKTWRDAISQDSQIWPPECEGKGTRYEQAQKTIFPARFVHDDDSITSYVALDPVCSCAFNILPNNWMESFTHVSLALPRLCCTSWSYNGYGSWSFMRQFPDSLALTHLDVRGAFPTMGMYTDGAPIMPNLEVARLINCEYLISGPKLRVLYFVALFSEILRFKDFFECLTGSPVLEVLHLHTVNLKAYYDDDDPRAQDPPPPMIPLQHLRHLSLSLQSDSQLSVLFMLDLPSDVEIHLEDVRGREWYDYEGSRPRLVPPLLMPERARQVIHTNISYAKDLKDVADSPVYDWKKYNFIGIDIGLDRSREGDGSPFKYVPEYIRVILAGDVGGALAGMSDSSHDAGAAVRSSCTTCLPRRSLSLRIHDIHVPSRRGQRVDAPIPHGFPQDPYRMGIEISTVTDAFQRYQILQPRGTLVLGSGSYTPQSPVEWHLCIREFWPSALVIPRAVFNSGQEPTPRGEAQLEALALYLRDGCVIKRGKTQRRCRNISLKSICVSSACLGEEAKLKLEKLASSSHPGAEKLMERGAMAVEWKLYLD